VGLRTDLDVLEKRKISYSYRDSNPGPSSPSPIAVYICDVGNSRILFMIQVGMEMASSEESKIINLLECPSCQQTMAPPIFLCEAGHNVCTRYVNVHTVHDSFSSLALNTFTLCGRVVTNSLRLYQGLSWRRNSPPFMES